VLGEGYEFSESAVTAVANTLALPAPVLTAISAAVTLAAGLREDAYHPVAWLETGNAAADLCHHARDLVPQDYVCGNPSP
jgi:hypothetical protein